MGIRPLLMRLRPRAAAGLLAALLGVVLWACSAGTTGKGEAIDVAAGETMPSGTQAGVVERIVDGDTIWVRIDDPGGPLAAGATHKVRLLEIDTPEVGGPGGAQCGGTEATAFAQRHLLVGSTVHLLADRQDTDRYGRFLRYVWTDDGLFFNEAAVRTGHARAVLYEPNDAYIEQLREAEAEARAAGRGIWGDC